MKINIFCFIILISAQSLLRAQNNPVLTAKQAVELALENNYGIKIANTNVAEAKNNATILNSGYLPSLTANAGVNFNIDNTEAEFSNGNVTVLDAAESSRYNASVDLNYTIFDGLGRAYNYKALKESHKLSKLQACETIEQTILQLFTVYYSLAQAEENTVATVKTLNLSKQRLIRAQYQFNYGQNTKLEVLNAQVDINNDSIVLMNSKQQLNNFKRDLNFVLGQVIDKKIKVDTSITLNTLYNKETLLQKALENNTSLLQINKNIDISSLSLKRTKSAYLPTVGLVGRYGWNKNNNNPASFVTVSTNTGLSAGLNLRWNLFDGGRTTTQVNNVNINIERQNLLKAQLLNTIKRDFNNMWDNYNNKLNIYRLQKQNIDTAKNNFNRSIEKFKLGQISSIAYRQAQLNLFNAEILKNQVKYEAKLIELQMLNICGLLLDASF